MQVVVRPAELEAAATRCARDAEELAALVVVARLDAAAAAVAGTTLAAAASTAAGVLRVAIFEARLTLAAYGAGLHLAAEGYTSVEGHIIPGGEQSR